MAQEYRNCIAVSGGTVNDRIKATQQALGLNLGLKGNWDWIEVQIEARNDNDHRRSDEVTKWDFYSRNFPCDLDTISQQFPALTFHCRCIDLSGGGGTDFKIKTNENGTCEEWDRETFGLDEIQGAEPGGSGEPQQP